jgi:hypothetical protein
MDQVRDQAWKDQGQAEKNVNSLKVEFDDGWRGSKVSFGGREMVNFAFVSDDEDARSTDLGQVIKIMVSKTRKGRLLQLALGLNNITLVAFFLHQHLTPLWDGQPD